MTRDEILKRWPNASESFIARNLDAGSERTAAVPQPPVRHEPLGSPQAQAAYSGRIGVRIVSRRCRLLDPDNPCPKFHIDALRYLGLIRDDRPQDIALTVEQEKVGTKAEECTIIELSRI